MDCLQNGHSYLDDVVSQQAIQHIQLIIQFLRRTMSDGWYLVLVALLVPYGSLEFNYAEAIIDLSILSIPKYIFGRLSRLKINRSLKEEAAEIHPHSPVPGILLRSKSQRQISKGKTQLRFKKTLYKDTRDYRDPSEIPRCSIEDESRIFNDAVNAVYYVEKCMYQDELPSNINLKTFIGQDIGSQKTSIIQDLTWPLIGLFESVRTSDYGTIFKSYNENIERVQAFDQKLSSALLDLVVSLRAIDNEDDAEDAIEYVTPLAQQLHDCIDSTLTILEDLQAGCQHLLSTIDDLLNLFGTEFRDFRDIELALNFCELYLSVPTQNDTNTRLVLACEKFDPASTPHTISAFSSYRNVTKGIMQIITEFQGIPSFLEETLWDCEKLIYTIDQDHEVSNIMKAHEYAALLTSMQTYRDIIESLDFYASSIEEYYLVVYEFLRLNRHYIKIAELSDTSQLSSSIGSCLLNSNDLQPHIDVASTAHVFRAPMH